VQEALNLVRTKCRPAHLPFSGILLQCRLVQIRSELLSDLCAFSFWGFCRSSFVNSLCTAGRQTSSLKRSRSCFCTAGICNNAVACGSALASSPKLRRRFWIVCEIWARGKGRPSEHSLDVGCWYSRYLTHIVSGFLSVSRSSRRTQEVESRRVWLARRDHRSSSEELQASKREVWRSFLVGRAVLSENSIVWSLQQRRIKVCEEGISIQWTRMSIVRKSHRLSAWQIMHEPWRHRRHSSS
jgi:hypothetical protein